MDNAEAQGNTALDVLGGLQPTRRTGMVAADELAGLKVGEAEFVVGFADALIAGIAS